MRRVRLSIAGIKAGQARVSFLCLGLFFATLFLYWPSTGFNWVLLDDPSYITNNKTVLAGLSWRSVASAFTDLQIVGYWTPLLWISYMLDVEVFGTHPFGFHLVNVLIFSINAALFLLLLVRFTGRPWPSTFIAAVFAFHPLRVESVAWIAERKDVLSVFFFLAALHAYVAFCRGRKAIWWYMATLGSIVLSLMAKPTLVTFPLLLLALDFWPLERWRDGNRPGTTLRGWLRLITEKIPFFIVSLLFGIITVAAQIEKNALQVKSGLVTVLLGIQNLFLSILHYMKVTLWPVGLSIQPNYEAPLVVVPVLITSGVIVVGISWFLARKAKFHPFLAVGWFGYILALLPVSGIVPVGFQVFSDRFTYVPHMLLLLGMFGAAGMILEVFHGRTWAVSSAVLLTLLLAVLSRQQLAYWRDSETLFRRSLQVNPANSTSLTFLGMALRGKGEKERANELFRRASTMNNALPLLQYGMALSEDGRKNEALEIYREILSIDPLPDNNLVAESLTQAAILLAQEGMNEEALAMFQRAVKLNPRSTNAHFNLGNLLEAMGHTGEAVIHFERAVKLAPLDNQARFNLARTLMQETLYSQAVVHFRTFLDIEPDSDFAPDAHLAMGLALAQMGEEEASLEHIRTAAILDPGWPEPHWHLAQLLESVGLMEEAIDQLREVVRLDPENGLALLILAEKVNQFGDSSEARTLYRLLSQRRPESAEYYLAEGRMLQEDGRPFEAVKAYHRGMAAPVEFRETATILERALLLGPDGLRR